MSRYFFFFKQSTSYEMRISDWSSDVCSSDLGNLHIAIGAGGPEDREKVEGCVYEPLRGIGGSVSAEHGIGLEKKAWFPITRNAQERSLMLDIKRMLDPKGILNPGKIFDAAPVSDTSLGEPNMPAWHEGPFNGAAGPDGGEHNVLSLTELGEGVSRRSEEHTSELQ